MINARQNLYTGLIAIFSLLSQYSSAKDVKASDKLPINHKTELEKIVDGDLGYHNLMMNLDYLALDVTYMMTDPADEGTCIVRGGMEKVYNKEGKDFREEFYKVGDKYLKSRLECFQFIHIETIETYDKDKNLIQRIQLINSNFDLRIDEKRIKYEIDLSPP